MSRVFTTVIKIGLILCLLASIASARPLYLQSQTVDSSALQLAALSQDEQISGRIHLIIQFSEILSEDQKDSFDELTFLQYVPEHAWIVSLDSSDLNKISSDPLVSFVYHLQPQDKALHRLMDRAQSSTFFSQEVDGEVVLEGSFFADATASEMDEILEQYSQTYSRDDHHFVITINTSLISSFLGQDLLKWTSDMILEKQTHNSNSRSLIGADILQSSQYNLTGQGVVVAEWDQGWAGSHDDLDGRVYYGDNGTCGGGDSGTCGILGHGTHVAGTVIGNGSITPSNAGMAPQAFIVSYEWFDSISEFSTEYSGAISTYNATISQNSWGYGCSSPVDDSCCASLIGDYRTDNTWIDNATRGSQGANITIVWSAGNQRSTSTNSCGNLGHTYNTTTPMGTAKNAITVGAVDDDSSMSSFSSWGPTDDGRIKPDVVANGVSVTSTEPGDGYGSRSGTSMAAPAVSGALALLFEKHYTLYSSYPNSHIAKALLIQTADDLGTTGPDYQNGYGQVNLTRAIAYVENKQNESLFYENTLTTTGDYITYTIEIDNAQDSLLFTLVWNDYQGSVSVSKQLVNDLDLLVYNASGFQFYPWTLDSQNPSTAAVQTVGDDTNNVEQVLISSPRGGVYTVIVNATTIPQGPQDFALIVSKTDQVAPSWTLNQTNTTNPSSTEDVEFSLESSDGKLLSGFVFSWNDSGSWSNISGVINDTNASISVNASISASNGTVVHWKFYVNDSLGNVNETDEFSFVVTDSNIPPQISSIILSSSDDLNRTNASITATFSVSSSEPANFTNESNWYNGSTLFDALANATTLTANYTLKNEQWTFSVRTFDGSNYSEWENASFNVLNAQPQVTQLANVTINETDQLNFTISATDVDTDSLTYGIDNGNFSLISTTFVWNTSFNDSGTYTFNVSVNDSQAITSLLVTATINDALDLDGDGQADHLDDDDDNDGLNDTADTLLGNASALNSSISGISVAIGNSTNLSQAFGGNITVNISNGSAPILTFNWSFSIEERLNLYNVSVEKQENASSNGSLIVRGVDLPEDVTKTVYLDRVSQDDYICIKDTEIASITEISLGCDGAFETFLQCNGSTSLGYFCNVTDDGNRYIVSGLNNSGVREQCQDADGDGYGTGCSLGTDCDDSDASKTTTCSSESGSSSSGGGGGGGGGGGAPSTTSSGDVNVLTETFVSMSSSDRFTLQGKKKELAITSVEFGISRFILKGILTAKKITRPDSVEPLSLVYQYLSLETAQQLNSEDIVDPTVTFRVEKEWIEDNEIDPKSILLHRYTDSWTQIDTSQSGSDEYYYLYEASPPGLSYFAITGEKVPKEDEQVSQQEESEKEQSDELEQPSAPSEQEEQIKEKPSTLRNWQWYALLAVVSVIIALIIIPKVKEKREVDALVKRRLQQIEKEEQKEYAPMLYEDEHKSAHKTHKTHKTHHKDHHKTHHTKHPHKKHK